MKFLYALTASGSGTTDTIIYSVDPNPSRSGRVGGIDIVWNGGGATLTVTQSGR
jgi:hypothetical protein